MNKKIEEIENQMIEKKEIPEFWPGDDVSVHFKIREGEKERIQVFTGTCIGRKAVSYTHLTLPTICSV